MPSYKFLQEKHPVYEANYLPWLIAERRLRGGVDILAELKPFDWELTPGALVQPFVDYVALGRGEREATEALAAALIPNASGSRQTSHYAARQLEATYMNFGDGFMRILVGHLLRNAPKQDADLDFGTLGRVVRKNRNAAPSRAELVYYNVDGSGSDGSQWNAFWQRAMYKAGGPGFRWMFVEATRERPKNQADEIKGLRPYMIDYSPLRVQNWHYENGQLQMAIIRTNVRRPRLDETGKLMGNKPEPQYLLLTAEGFDGFGPEFAGGGWFLFGSDFEPIVDRSNKQVLGNFDLLEGQVPLFPLYYERDEGSEQRPDMARSGTWELGQLSVSYMNLASAADWDAFDAASSTMYVLGASLDAFNIMVEKMKESRVVPVPRDANDQIPQMFDGSTGMVANGVFEKRFETKRAEAQELAAREATSTPESSGVSKQMGFVEAKSPRLALMAEEMENGQNTAIKFLEQRFGPAFGSHGPVNPTGYVLWTRDFDLAPLVEDIEKFFELEVLKGISSPTLDAKLFARAAQEFGFISTDDEVKQVEAEFTESSKNKDAASAAFGSIGGLPDGGVPAGGGNTGNTGPPASGQNNNPAGG